MKIYKKRNFFSFKISIPSVTWLCVTSSFLTFFFCVIWSILYNFEEANATHCSVENFLPSISAAIGHFYPQIYVWNTSVILQMIPRLKIATIYLHYYSSVIHEKYFHLCYLSWIFNICELWALLGLSLITSTSNYNIHAFCFVSFLFSSMFYMVLSCFLLKFRRKIPLENSEKGSVKWKIRCSIINICCFFLAGYFFRRHNIYCEPRVYSLFAFFEYGVVASNILFHFSAVWDFYDRIMTIDSSYCGFQIDYNPPYKSAIYDFK
ncbi:fgf receptor activating protein, putative [Pediculus humanus corporis]|nr:fgf receptor activating protein, putative [Pediculus humanus corporis]EEB20288.1 fgf receptor activating protein, putative [Pediculus humanus corporis]